MAGCSAAAYGLLYLDQRGASGLSEAGCACDREEDRIPHRVPAVAASAVGGTPIGLGISSREREVWRRVRLRDLRPAPAAFALSVSSGF